MNIGGKSTHYYVCGAGVIVQKRPKGCRYKLLRPIVARGLIAHIVYLFIGLDGE